MNSVNRLIPIGLGAAALLAVSLLIFAPRPWLGSTGNDEMVVAVAEVKRGSRPLLFHITGQLQPASEVDVASRVAGRLTEVKFKPGDTVRAGNIVATVYSGELAERLRLIEAELNATKKQLKEREQQAADANQHFAHLQELYRQDLIARRDVEQAEIKSATARAELELVRSQIAQAQAILSQTSKLQQLARIVAPISGVITGALSPGVPVNETRVILTIAQIDIVKLIASVPANYAKLIDTTMKAEVSSGQRRAEVRNGEVFRSEETISGAGTTVPIEVRIDNRDQALQLGATVTATLRLTSPEHLMTIPSSALHSATDQHYVFQIVNGRATRRRVELDATNTDPAVIRAGLNAGDLVIVDRLGAVREGVRVRATAQIK